MGMHVAEQGALPSTAGGAESPPGELLLAPPPPSHWLLAMCLIGVDYFSTLAYQASITFRAAGCWGLWPRWSSCS